MKLKGLENVGEKIGVLVEVLQESLDSMKKQCELLKGNQEELILMNRKLSKLVEAHEKDNQQLEKGT